MTDDAKSDVRLEKDTFGEIAVPNAKLWGAQTQRSLQNFKISSEKQSPELITALAIVKRAAAEVNLDLKVLDAAKAQRDHRRPPTRSSTASIPTNSRSPSGRRARARRPT